MGQKQVTVQTSQGDVVYYNFTVDQHTEIKKEKVSGSVPVYNAQFDFIYNREAKAYEAFISANRNLTELNLINFYDLVDSNSTNKKNNLVDYFQKDFEDKLNQTTNKTIIYNNNLKQYQAFKDVLPFYTQIKFDNIQYRKSKMFSLFKQYNIQEDILRFFSNNIKQNSKYVEISNSILLDNDIINDYSFFNKFQDIIDNNGVRRFSGNKQQSTYFEVIGYKISKFYGSKGFKGNPVQEWYIPNTETVETEFVDSQIKYSTKYYYKLSLIIATIGQNRRKSTGDFSVYIVEVDSTDYEGFLLESPPIYPDIYFAPYIGEANKIKVLLNGIVDKYNAKPIKILQSDIDLIKTLESSDLVRGDKVAYESKDTTKKFQVMRLETPPISYEDFAFGKIVNIPEGLTTFEDDIESNKKYYYTARAIDFHGQISNPTEIFTVEMVNDLGTIYPMFGTYTFQKQEEIKQLTKKLNNILSIQPRLAHLIYEEERNKNLEGKTDDDAILQSVNIGTVTPEVWDKKFKIRVTSLSTGKKIDLNLQFKKQRLQKKQK